MQSLPIEILVCSKETSACLSEMASPSKETTSCSKEMKAYPKETQDSFEELILNPNDMYLNCIYSNYLFIV